MKRIFLWCVLGLLLVVLTALALTCVKPPAGRFDFQLRMNEVSCLRLGVDPYDVWSEKTYLPPFCSNLPKNPVPPECNRLVNAYVPWAYTMMLPFSYLSSSGAWCVYCILMGLSIALILRLSKTDSCDHFDRVMPSTLAFLAVSYLIWSNVSVGNFIVFVLAASVIMAWMLSRGRDCTAGLFWAIAMIKPQSAVLFAVPLLLRGKWKTCFVAGGTCLAASVIPMLMCRSSLVDLLIEGPAANAELFEGCGTWPKCFCGFWNVNVDIALGLLIGLVLCIWMTWKLRHEQNWFIYLMPAAICGASWTYTQAYSHAMGWFVAFALVSELLKNPRSRFLWILSIAAILVLPRVILAAHGFCVYFATPFQMDEFSFRVVDSFNSTFSLLLAFLFCLWKSHDLRGHTL